MSELNSRRGGRRARRNLRTVVDHDMRPALKRGIPVVEVMDEEQVQKIHNASMEILEEVGVDFRDDVAIDCLLYTSPSPRDA